MTVAREFEAEPAAALGVVKAFHLVQYARVARTRFRASVLAERDAKIGKPARRISTMTAVSAKEPIAIVELSERSVASVIGSLLMPLFVLLVWRGIKRPASTVERRGIEGPPSHVRAMGGR